MSAEGQKALTCAETTKIQCHWTNWDEGADQQPELALPLLTLGISPFPFLNTPHLPELQSVPLKGTAHLAMSC